MEKKQTNETNCCHLLLLQLVFFGRHSDAAAVDVTDAVVAVKCVAVL